MIKNEAQYLEASLRSVLSWASDALVVDTGSTDDSVQIVKRHQADFSQLRFESLKWSGDFAQMRNQIAALAKEDWVLFIDGDEVLEPGAETKLAAFLKNPHASVFSIIQRNLCKTSQTEGSVLLDREEPLKLEGPLYFFDNYMERLYQPSEKLQFRGRIHESLLPDARKNQLGFEKTDLVFWHYGRLKSNHRDKLLGYLELSRRKWKEEIENPAAWMEVLLILGELEQNREALQIAQLASRKFSKEPELLKLCSHFAMLEAKYAIAEAWYQQALRSLPGDLELQSKIAFAQMYQGKIDQAFRQAQNVLEQSPEDFTACLVLGVIHFERSEFKESKPFIASCLKKKPDDAFLNEAMRKLDQ